MEINTHYQTGVLVNTSQKAAFHAVSKKIENWWGKVDNPKPGINEEFSVYFDKTEWRFLITDYIPYDKITWKCIKANHQHEGLSDIKQEWLNTFIYWTFSHNGDFTKVSLKHQGLTPDLNCYNVCESGWDFFISTSLKNYLETGQGNPYNNQ